MGGHVDQNNVSVFQLPKTAIVQASVANGNHVKGGGYWVYCVKDGAVTARIFRQLGGGFVVDGQPDRSRARPLSLPFRRTGRPPLDAAARRERRGQDLLPERQGRGLQVLLVLLTELVYKLPLGKAGHKATHVAVLGRLDVPKGIAPVSVAVSTDNRSWTNLPLPAPHCSVYTMEIPAEMRNAEGLFIRVTGPGYGGNVTVGGFALCR